MNKIMGLKQAISTLLQPNSSLAIGCALEGFIPYAAAHEIIRQKIGNLTLIGPISNTCFDQLIGANLVTKVIAAWVGNVSTGIGYNFRRAVEEGLPQPLKVINHSNFSIGLALEAGSRGLSMAISASPLGSDIPLNNPHFTPFTCPFSNRRLLAIKAVNPDLAIVHVQKSDSMGNCQLWGASGVSQVAAMASKKVLITCEELVETKIIKQDPDRTFLPGFCVDAVCCVPFGAHPAPCQGYYGLDNESYLDYANSTRTIEESQNWLSKWIYNLSDHREYLAKLGNQRLTNLKVKHSRLSSGVEYGY